MEERDKWEDIICSKLKGFEADTEPGDWKAIESRLPGKKVMLSNRWYYVAAGIAMFLFLSVGYYYLRQGEAPSNSPEGGGLLADTQTVMDIPKVTEQQTEKVTENDIADEVKRLEQVIPVHINQLTAQVLPEKSMEKPEKDLFDLALLPVSPKIRIEVKNSYPAKTLPAFNQALRRIDPIRQIEDIPYIADATPFVTDKKSGRRWGIGAGGGSYSTGSGGSGFVNSIRLHSSAYTPDVNNDEWFLDDNIKRDDYFNELLSNSISEYNITSIQKVGITHKQPVSFGIGVGYALDKRWSLQSGLVYTLLSSEWRTELPYQGKFKQQLHFAGIPLGVSYQIAEWNKIRFYAMSGGMMEWNVAGNVKTNYYFIEENEYCPVKESVRMKELQWSVNGRVGATYPVIKFVNVYVEGGANYYFDNKRSIETIRTDKPFHVSLQAGLRFGF